MTTRWQLVWVVIPFPVQMLRRVGILSARHLRRVRGPTLTGSALRRAVVAVFVSYARSLDSLATTATPTRHRCASPA